MSDQADPDSLGQITHWADAMTEAIIERNRAIRAAVAAGHSQRQVAKAAGLTHPGVAKILARTADGDHPADGPDRSGRAARAR